MNNLIITQEDNNATNQIIDGILQLRHETFIERLDWNIPSVNGRERDYFDDLQPYHIAVLNQNKSVVNGCWRALPTTGDYMLKSIFPELLQGEAAPCCAMWGDSVLPLEGFCKKKGFVGKLRRPGSFFHDFASNDIKACYRYYRACERFCGIGLVCAAGAASAMQMVKNAQ